MYETYETKLSKGKMKEKGVKKATHECARLCYTRYPTDQNYVLKVNLIC